MRNLRVVYPGDEGDFAALCSATGRRDALLPFPQSAKASRIYCSVRPYGWEGPPKMLAGFDTEAVTVSGFTAIEGSGPDHPRFPHAFVMNDMTPSRAVSALLG